MMINEVLQEKLKLLPTKSGVYLMKNKQKQIIYVGKAINLKIVCDNIFNRVEIIQQKQLLWCHI